MFTIQVTYRQTGVVHTFYQVEPAKTMQVVAYLKTLHNTVSYEVTGPGVTTDA